MDQHSRRAMLIFAVCAAGCSDQSLSLDGTAPLAFVVSPAADTLVREGTNLTLEGICADVQSASAELDATWYAGDALLCNPRAPNPDGTTTCTSDPVSEETVFTLECRDPAGVIAKASVTVGLTGEQAPQVEFVLPIADSVLGTEDVQVVGRVSDADDALEDLAVWLESDIDGRLADIIPDAEGNLIASVALSPAAHRLTLHAEDPVGLDGAAQVLVNADCSSSYGHSAQCAATSCLAILEAGQSVGDGIYWLDPIQDGAFQVRCDMSADDGGWTLVAVVSDDGVDTWTWSALDLWGTSFDAVGTLDALDHDFRSEAFPRLLIRDVMFQHRPSYHWAAYANAGFGGQTLGEWIASKGQQCYGTAPGVKMTAGTLQEIENLCDTDLYVNPRDQDGNDECLGTNDTWGPAWSAQNNNACPLDDPSGESSLGPDPAAVDVEQQALGFANALGLNGGAPGEAENYMWVFVR